MIARVARFAVIPFICLLALTAIASGQETPFGREPVGGAARAGEYLPDPATSRELSRDLERFVSPTVAQWLAIEDLHEAYLDRFAELRDEDIARFLKFAEEELEAVPDARTARTFTRRLESTRARIDETDDALFAGIAESLEPEQLPGLQRVRLARERNSLRSGIARIGGGPLSLDDVLGACRRFIDAESLRALDPVLVGYEQSLTGLLREWRDSRESMFLELVDELQARGLGEFDGRTADPERMQQAFLAFQAAYDAARLRNLRVEERLDALNRRTVSALVPLLGEELGRRFRLMWASQWSEGEIASDPLRLERTFARLLESDQLAPEDRESIIALRREWRAVDDRHVERQLELRGELLEIGLPYGVPVPPDDERAIEADRILELFFERSGLREQLAETTRERLVRAGASIGSPRLSAIISSSGAPITDRDESDASASRSGVRDPERGGPADFIPDRLSRRQLSEIRERLASEPWQQAVLDTVYDDYLDAWRNEVAPLDRSCKEALASVYSIDPETGRQRADPAQMELAYGHALDALARVVSIEDRFFDDLSVALDPARRVELRRLRLVRELDRNLRGTDPFFRPSELAFRSGNVLEVVDGLELPVEVRGRVDELLANRGRSLIDAARRGRELRFDSERRFHEMNLRLSRGMADGTLTSTDHGLEYRRISEELAVERGTEAAEWDRVREEFITELRTLLDPDSRRLFDRDWNRAENPVVYRDPNAAFESLERALALSDLDADQLDAVARVLAGYDERWNELSMEMASLHRAKSEYGARTSPEDWSEWKLLDDRYRALELERYEASLRALRRVARYLRPEQRARVPALEAILD